MHKYKQILLRADEELYKLIREFAVAWQARHNVGLSESKAIEKLVRDGLKANESPTMEVGKWEEQMDTNGRR